MLIPRPVKSWKRSASFCGGWLSLFGSIGLCLLGKHRWADVYNMDSDITVECFICGKDRNAPTTQTGGE